MGNKVIKITLLSIAAVGFIATAVGLFAIKDSRDAFAADKADWIAGSIISDATFTDNNSMSTEEIQSFLDKNIDGCDIWGTERATEFGYNGTRAQYAASKGWAAPPYTCLNKYYEVPKTSPGGSMPANNYANPDSLPAGAQSAAWIIKDAANRYSISPKVLLVKLATESAGPLTGDKWPLFGQYKYAMGAYCPDSGPGGSANCNEAYAGFSIQMYKSAELLRYYLNNMNQPWWTHKKPGNNQILWNVEPRGCGSSNVNIQNKATAALYTYTPYQPNQAALNNLYGTGDNCSAYGNRNFWRVFWDWFGDTRNSQPYKWSLRSVNIYADPARTQLISTDKIVNLQPGQQAYASVVAENTGTSSWDTSTILETTNDPVLGDASWIARNKTTKAKEGIISTGQSATYEFTFKAPSTPRIYTQHFNLHNNNSKTWFNPTDLYVKVTSVEVMQNPGISDANRLKTGEVMLNGDIKYSPEGHSALRLQNGKLQLFSNFQEVWSSNTTGDSKSRLVNQTDGNLVLYDGKNKVLWASDTHPDKATLTIQTDGNAVHRNTVNNQPLWASNTGFGNQLAQVNVAAEAGGVLFPTQSLTTVDRKAKLVLQTDGNLVLYNKNKKAIWASDTNGRGATRAAFQSDGNLVLYDKSNRAVWASDTNSRGGLTLTLQEDLNVVIYSADRKAIWATHTAGR